MSAWWRWWKVPWSDVATATALVAAAATPVFLVGSAAVWRAAAEDDIAHRAVADAPLDRNGVDLAVESAFDPAGVVVADAAVRDELARLGPMSAPVRTAYTLPGLLTIGPPVRQVGPSGRLLAQDGALDAVVVTEQLPDTTGGVWVTSWFAERHGLTLGDGIGFEAGAIVDEEWNDLVQGGGASGVFRIVGLYEPLWSSDPTVAPDPFWTSDAPPGVLPSFIPAFNGPSSELVLTDEQTLLSSGLTGVVRWRAPLTSIPDAYDALRDLRDGVRRFELSGLGTTTMGASLAAISTDANRRPTLTTDLFETTAEVERAASRLTGPLASVRAVGLTIGLLVVAAAGWFVVDRRRSEYRLLASEGEGTLRMAARAAAQLAAPVAVGGLVGAVVAVAGPWALGPADRFAADALPWWTLGGVVVATLVAAALAVGFSGARSLRGHGHVTARRVLPVAMLLLAVATVFLWAQIGRTDVDGITTVDLAVVALPIVGLLLAVAVSVVVATWLLARFGRRATSLPDVAYLAVRRFATGALGMQLVAAAVGLGVGLVVFSSALTSTLDRTVDVKLATEVGGAATALLNGAPAVGTELPAGSTVVRTFDTILTPGQIRVRVVAIDAATFADAVTWPDEFGSSAADVVDVLAGPIDGSVPAVAVSGEPAVDDGAFGLTQTWAFRVERRVRSVPFAGETDMTIMVDGDRLDRFALDEAGYGTVAEANGDNYLVPTQRFRVRVVTQAELDELTAALDAGGVDWRDGVSAAERRRAPDLLAARAAFGYLSVLGIVAGVAALVSLALYLAARRRARAIAGAMTRSMGLTHRAAAAVTSLEVGSIVSIAVAAGLAVAPTVIRRLSGRFDPAPDLPPPVAIAMDRSLTAGTAVVGVAAIMAAVWLIERRAAGRPVAEVLRGDG